MDQAASLEMCLVWETAESRGVGQWGSIQLLVVHGPLGQSPPSPKEGMTSGDLFKLVFRRSKGSHA